MWFALQIYKYNSDSKTLEEHFEIVHVEYATISDFATFAGGKDFDIAPTSVKIVSERDTIFQFEYRAVGFPNGNIDRVAGVEHGASGGYVD